MSGNNKIQIYYLDKMKSFYFESDSKFYKKSK